MTQVFVSYKTEDRDFAARLCDHLRAWGFVPWLDAEQIKPGMNWDEAIDTGLKASEIVLGLMAPESIASENVLNEWAWAHSNGKALIPLKLRDIPVSDIPHRYIRVQYIDFTQNEITGFEHLRQRLLQPETLYHPGVVSTPTPVTQTQTQTQTQSASVILESKHANSPRSRLLQKVREYWIHGVLEKSIASDAINLDMTATPKSTLKFEGFDYALAPNTGIIQIFEDVRHKLLILGAPGSGKTMLMLQLARDLITRAEEDERQPIPVVLNLWSWTEKVASIEDWLVNHLKLDYQIPEKIGQLWVENGALLLLLDGLDEVNGEQRDACVEAINAFRKDYPFVDAVICSRVEEYNNLAAKLDVHGAIMLQPLTPAQIASYTAKGDYTGLRTLIDQDAIMRDMAQTPFLLNAMMFSYHGLSAAALSGLRTLEARRDDLFEAFVKKRFHAGDTYTLKDTRHYLSWMASHMVQRSQTLFYIENLQPNWLNDRQRKRYVWLVRGLVMLIGFLIAFQGKAYHLNWTAHANALLLGAGIGLVMIGVKIVAGLRGIVFIGAASWLTILVIAIPIMGAGDALGYLLVALLGGILFGGIPGSIAGGQKGLIAASIAGFIVSMVSPLSLESAYSSGGIFFAGWLVAAAFAERDRIRAVEILSFKLRSLNRRIIFIAIIIGLGIGVLQSISQGLSPSTNSYTSSNLVAGLLGGAVVGIILGAIGDGIEMRTLPNQGIRRSISYALMVGLFAGVATVVILLLANGLLFLFAILQYGLSLGLMVGLIFGGTAALQHAALRYVLAWDGDMPRNEANFLDYAANIGILRKVGGGYIFVHRYLLEYFAGLGQNNI